MSRPMRVLLLLVAALAAGPAGLVAPATAATLPGGQPLTAELARAVVADALPAPAAGDGWAITFTSPAFPLANRAAGDAAIAVDMVELPPEGGALMAVLRVTLPGGETGRLVVRGRAEPAVEVPVPARPLAAGATIAADDLARASIARRLLPAGAVTASSDIVGQETVRRLPAGRVISTGQLRPARQVAKGDPVRVTFRRAGLELSLDGTALEAGAAGQTIRVLNPNGGRELRGVVTGPGEIRVGAAEEPGA